MSDLKREFADEAEFRKAVPAVEDYCTHECDGPVTDHVIIYRAVTIATQSWVWNGSSSRQIPVNSDVVTEALTRMLEDGRELEEKL